MELTTKIEGLDKARADLDAIAARAQNLSPALNRLGLWHQRKAARVLRSGEKGIQARNPAGLAASITFAQSGPNDLLVGSNKVYAASQQFGPAGGYYVPVQAKLLAIPIGDNLGARGNPKFNSPRDVPDGFFFRVDNKLYFGRQKGRKKKGTGQRRSRALSEIDTEKLQVLFVLVPRAKGQAHYYITHEEPDQQFWDRTVGNYLLRGTL